MLWRMDLGLLSPEMARAVGRMPDYGARLERAGKVLLRYHVVGAHGGAWLYDVDSHEEFERLLGSAPVFNFATYDVIALADMTDAEQGSPDDGTDADLSRSDIDGLGGRSGSS